MYVLGENTNEKIMSDDGSVFLSLILFLNNKPYTLISLPVYQTQTYHLQVQSSIMAFAAAQTTSFIEDADQMALTYVTIVQLKTERITNIDDLGNFGEDDFSKIVANLCKPPGGVVAFTSGAKSQKRLLAAAKIVRFYETIGHNLTVPNMR